MPYMLQPKSYVQIARPNLYNVAYRRVGAYKGMGRLHPTNYLEIGIRPNRIGATTGQYNTASGQLSLLPPSLRGVRGLGQSIPLCADVTPDPNFVGPIQCDPSAGPLNTSGAPSVWQLANLPTNPSVWNTPIGQATLMGAGPGITVAQLMASGQIPIPKTPPTPTPTDISKYLPYIIGGGFLLVLLLAGRR
jgi:hypothetical protein